MTYASRLDLDTALRAAVLPILQSRLSDTLDLQAQVKQAHWNLRGPAFIALHDLFDRIAADIALAADDTAERIVALGGYADGRPFRTARDTSLPGWPERVQAQGAVLDALAASISAHGRGLRDAIDSTTQIGDAGTADLFTGQSRQTDKQLWLVEAHLSGMKAE
ncbi:DNA starvation/stationary phase protection protein Dps [Fertoebacter nigrum]|uniref:DNA starvation/stationary phase protection protein Dps n=2 Tax=Fertoeibacter niger TaxID=2656921 RepID=A0A8X8KQG1_9RHOB|nr:DNA starvation/stationary phase protection protein Dps [Fertoeibacter niger]